MRERIVVQSFLGSDMNGRERTFPVGLLLLDCQLDYRNRANFGLKTDRGIERFRTTWERLFDCSRCLLPGQSAQLDVLPQAS